ncbi:hypothetical protein ACHAO9_008016 [Fusarium lateritium]
MVACYCSAVHQALDQTHHEKACNTINEARKPLQKAEQELRNHPGDRVMPANIFKRGVGRFHRFPKTRVYIRARFNLVACLLGEFGSPGGHEDAVREGLYHLLHILRLSDSDTLGVREIVPHLYLRLNKDQEAYDFLNRHAAIGAEYNYDWVDAPDSYRDIKGADVLEEPLKVWSNGSLISLSHVAAVTLIKVKVLLDLQAAQSTSRALRSTMPLEIIDLIRYQLVGSVVHSRPEILRRNTEEISALIQTTKLQIIALYKSANTFNPHFWRLMLSSEVAASQQTSKEIPFLSLDDCLISCVEAPGAYLAISYSLAPWVETPGAFELMKNLSENI